jgi:hypothetical protein
MNEKDLIVRCPLCQKSYTNISLRANHRAFNFNDDLYFCQGCDLTVGIIEDGTYFFQFGVRDRKVFYSFDQLAKYLSLKSFWN